MGVKQMALKEFGKPRKGEFKLYGQNDSSAVVCKMAASHVVKCRKFCLFIDVSRVYAITTILSNQNSHKLTRTRGCRLYCTGKNKDSPVDNAHDESARPCQTASSHKIQKKVRLDEKKLKEVKSSKLSSYKDKDKDEEEFKEKNKSKEKVKDKDKEKEKDKVRFKNKGKDQDNEDDDDDDDDDDDREEKILRKEVTIEYYRGLPQITVPLPSRKERCRFTLRPVSNTVGDFLHMLCTEDRGIDHVSVSTPKGIRIASSNTIEALMEDDFRLVINDICYHVKTPKQEKLSIEEIERLSDVKNLVHQLYEALNVEEHQIKKERELCVRLEELKVELEPMEEKKQQLHKLAERRTNVLTWVGLGLMSVQFGILARLTWWEYSWDIMEPVTYFVTYGTAMAAYAYYVLTKQEYILPDVKDREYLITLHKKAKKLGLDLERYNNIKEQIHFIEHDLKRLRDPLQVHLPPHHLADSLKKSSNPFMKAFHMFQRKSKESKSPEKEISSATTTTTTTKES